MGKSEIPPPERRACRCGSMITLAPWTEDTAVLIPVDVDRDPEGDLVVVGSRRGFTVRLLLDGEQPQASLRRRAHWAVCPHQRDWVGVMTRLGLRRPRVEEDRAGMCAACGRRHAWRYGGPIASPVCDRCRMERGHEIMGEPW